MNSQAGKASKVAGQNKYISIISAQMLSLRTGLGHYVSGLFDVRTICLLYTSVHCLSWKQVWHADISLKTSSFHV